MFFFFFNNRGFFFFWTTDIDLLSSSFSFEHISFSFSAIKDKICNKTSSVRSLSFVYNHFFILKHTHTNCYVDYFVYDQYTNVYNIYSFI